jgi:sec-independent protein translocase protein TatC
VADPDWIARYRRHCLVGALVLGALLTPSDPLSMLLMAAPLYLLFELGLLLMRLARGWREAKRRQAHDTPSG